MSAVDPARLESLVRLCDDIISRMGGTVSDTVCEDVEQLDHLHDRLAYEVENMASLLRETLETLQTLARSE